jgi:hypothetical protein
MKPIVVQRIRRLRHLSFFAPWYSAVLCFLLPAGIVFARLAPEDLAAITETGLTALTGEQEGEYPVRDYVVVETMRISRGDTVTFTGGSRILFHPNARITVFGTLQFLGTSRNKITLGKLPFKLQKLSGDHKVVFDSTSIFVYRQSHLTLRHTIMDDSSIKIRLADTTATFTLDTVTFSDNHFLLPDTSFFFPAKSIVTCKMDLVSPFIPCAPVLADTTPKLVQVRHASVNPVVPLRFVLGAGILGAAGAWFYFNEKANRSYESYERSKNPDDAAAQRELNRSSVLYRNLTAIAGICGLTGFTVTFFFGGRRQ